MLAKLAIGVAAQSMGQVELGLQRDGLREVVDRAPAIAEPQVHRAAEIEQIGIARIERNRCIVVANRAPIVLVLAVFVGALLQGAQSGSIVEATRREESSATADRNIGVRSFAVAPVRLV